MNDYRCRPLELCLEELAPVEILHGLHDILTALTFVHDVAKLSHNNLCRFIFLIY